MDEEMRVGIRLHRRLFGRNDVLDNELNYKVRRMNKEQKRRCSQLETDIDYLKRELSKCSISRKTGSNEEHRLSQEWDKPSPVVLKARLMLKSVRPPRKDEERNTASKTILPRNVIRLEDLPRKKYEERLRERSDKYMLRMEQVDKNVSVPDPFVNRLSRQSPNSSTQTREPNGLSPLHNKNPSAQGLLLTPDCEDFPRCVFVRRSSDDRDVNLVSFNTLNCRTERRRSLPSILIDPVKSHDVFLKAKGTVSAPDRNVFPGNAEKRIQMRRSSTLQMCKYLADNIARMSNQEFADIQRLRQS